MLITTLYVTTRSMFSHCLEISGLAVLEGRGEVKLAESWE